MMLSQADSKKQPPILIVKNRDMLFGFVLGKASVSVKKSEDTNGDPPKEEIEVPSKENTKQNPAYLEISCSCGFFMQFKTYNEVPEQDISCPVCERLLVQYHHAGEEEIFPVHITFLLEATRFLENIYLVLLHVVEKFPDNEYILRLDKEIKDFLVQWRKHVLRKST